MRHARIWVAFVILGGVAAVLYVWLAGSRTPERPVPSAVPVELATVERADVPVVLRALGHVKSLSSIDVRPQVDGMLVELPATEGKAVKRGELLARIDDRAIAASLRQAQAERDVTRAELDIAKLDLQRYRNLVRERASPAQVLDQQKALVARLQATLATREAAVAAASVSLSYTRITSPIDGRVGIRNAYVGSMVRGSDPTPLFSVVQIDPIAVETSLPQSRLPALQDMLAGPGSARVEVAYQDGEAPAAQGVLTLIDNRVDAQSGTIRARARFENGDQRLWPDQSVIVSLETERLMDVPVIPARAIRQGANGAFVWRVRDGKAETVPVTLRYQDDLLAASDDLAPGDRIVVDGQSRLRPGIAVRPAESAAPETSTGDSDR